MAHIAVMSSEDMVGVNRSITALSLVLMFIPTMSPRDITAASA